MAEAQAPRASDVADVEWHGWRINGRALHIGLLPGRKQVCLYELDRGRINTLAFFTTEDKARVALDMLDRIANASGVIA